MITCRVLGPVELLVDDGPAPAELLWRKNLALLVYLARSPKRARSRDHLTGLLWGDKPESAARHSLNEAVRVLRKYATPGGLESDAGQVRLSPEAVQIDVDGFEERVGREDWAGASELVVGEFMEGFGVPGCSEFEDWLYGERMLWRERSVDVLVRRAAQLLNAGELGQAAVVAHRALAIDPTSAAAAKTAMRSLAMAGDRAGALAVYEAFVKCLEEEVGIEPDEDVSSLAELVRRERTWKLPERLTVGGVAGAESRRAPLVGRETELAQLIDAWTGCRTTGRAVLALVFGEPGTGKTRLAEELLARARLDGALTVTARSVEADLGDGWSGALALARALPLDAPGLDRAPATALATLARHLPEWKERFGRQGKRKGEEPNPGRAFADVVSAVATEQPVFLFLDDAHWLDHDTLLTVAGLLRDLEALPLCVTIAAAAYPDRPELEELRARIGRDLAGVCIRLRPLSAGAIRALARWALPMYEEVELDRVTRRVSTDSAGLPLLAVELLHAVALGLDLHSTRGAWPEPLRTLDQTLPGGLPDAVVAAVRVGFRRLSKDAQSTLAAASVLADRVDAAALRRATGLDQEPLAAALDELEWQRWLTAEPRGYAFVARIVREVVARDMLTPGQRQRILAAASAS
jgi:DNA-binding SARP family transcriptional activator